jgi:hypothetical protein
MSEKEQLIKELEQAPDFLVRQVLNFLLFIKTYGNENSNQEASQNVEESKIPDYLNFIDQINSETQNEKMIPKDFAKNLDRYLYGTSKESKTKYI